MLHRKGQKSYRTDLSLLGQEPTFKAKVWKRKLSVDECEGVDEVCEGFCFKTKT